MDEGEMVAKKKHTNAGLEALSDDELRVEQELLSREVLRRRGIAEEERKRRHDVHQEVLSVLDRRVLDQLRPKHDRTSCSDTHRINGWVSDARCVRCALLDTLNDGYIPPKFWLRLTVCDTEE